MQDRGPEDEIGDDGRNRPRRSIGVGGPERLEAFSDGVFADRDHAARARDPRADRRPARRPGRADQGARRAVAELRSATLISFVTIGIIWANHHNLFRLVATRRATA